MSDISISTKCRLAEGFCQWIYHNILWDVIHFLVLYFMYTLVFGVSDRFVITFYLFCLWAGRLRGQSSSPGRMKKVHFSVSSRLTLGSTQPPIQWVPGALSLGGKVTGA
jgi:hypothetical protein